MGFLSGICFCLEKRGSSAGDREEEADDGGEPFSFFFELQALQKATDFFSESSKIGIGKFGDVYKGLMPNGQLVAVKKLSPESHREVREFINEVKLLLKIQHKNLVMLLGCCAGPENFLVYKYFPNGSLECILFDKKFPSLDWPERFRILSGVARGLLYLHEEAPERIIHRNIKAGNILLDDQLNPKITDFGLVTLLPRKCTHMNRMERWGTLEYMSPEYARHGYLSVKTDVFSFGVLVLEIVSGRRHSLYSEEGDLLASAWMLFQEGKTLELVDPRLGECNPEEVAMCIQVGLLCCQESAEERPDMSSVHLMLSSDSSSSLHAPGKLPRDSFRYIDHFDNSSLSFSSIDEGR